MFSRSLQLMTNVSWPSTGRQGLFDSF
jgi:hypothetical protein